jgi:hypothetical protein
MITQRHDIRQPAGNGNELLISVIPFDAPEAIEISADVVDLSDGGLGIMTHRPVDADFVLVREKTGWQKGVVVWNREQDEKMFRAGIRLVPAHLAGSEERQKETYLPPALAALRDCRLVASILVDEVEQPKRWW